MADSELRPDLRPDLDLTRAVLTDAFERIRDGVPEVVEGLADDDLLWRPDDESNHVAWLVWHLARQQDVQLAALGDETPVWESGGWADRFGLSFDADEMGYGMSSKEVGAFVVRDASLFAAYQSQVHELAMRLIEGLDADGFERVVDDNWDPPVTAMARIVSVLDDAAKHLGQAEYVRGLLERRQHTE